ncbi:MAG: AraC family transcriptional regulator [Defluviitaleaceae bacterium]|nr:AraC family transcriptional regulator [Defluviitaleaceae bacterium]MCL2274600.1 AraC family transcriptional regulator [Defluviitaleaceae bacterium]
MHEWQVSIQGIIDWIEGNIENNPTLLTMSREVGYSPHYCSVLFHRICGVTLKRYLAARRLCYAAVALRDTTERILDIALRFGFSSQEALTRAFVKEFGCTPAAYRTNPKPIALSVRKVVLSPNKNLFGGIKMNTVKEANVRFEYIPAHKYVGIWETRATNYGEFWEYHNCDEVCGIIESMRHTALEVVGCHQAGWFTENGVRSYFYGLGVPADYTGQIPEGFAVRDIPASTYLVFFHPPFDYLADNVEVMQKVETLAWNFNPKESSQWWINDGYTWDENAPCYQRHFPEVLGYEVLRPVRKGK